MTFQKTITSTCISCGLPIEKTGDRIWIHTTQPNQCYNLQEPARFVSIRQNIMQGSQCIARSCSKTMAKRIANALNNHTPNREGV